MILIRCPFCAEEVEDGTTICRFCGSDLTKAASPAPQFAPTPASVPWTDPVAHVPAATATQATFSHTGQRYVLGYDAATYGIWDRNAPGEPAVQSFPRTPGGWQHAWASYSSLEPANAPVAGPPASFGPAPTGSGPPQQPQSTNGMAVASLVLGILWLWWIGSILALVFGYIGKKQIKDSRGSQGGKGLAIAGIVLGWIGVATFVLFLVFGLAAGRFLSTSTSFSGFPANDRAAEANLRNGMAAAKTYFTDSDSYSGADAATLQPIDPSLQFTDATLALPGEVSIHGVTSQTIVLVTRSASGKTLCIADDSGGAGLTFGQTNAQTAADCQGGWPGSTDAGNGGNGG